MSDTGSAPDAEGPSKRTAAKKAAKKTARKPVKKAAKKSAGPSRRPAAKTAAKASPPPRGESSSSDRGRDEGSSANAPKGMQAALLAATQLVDLTGKDFEGIVGIAKGEDGWQVEMEVVEMRRIPSTTDVLAIYEVSLDASGDLVGYKRVNRYVRGNAGEDRG